MFFFFLFILFLNIVPSFSFSSLPVHSPKTTAWIKKNHSFHEQTNSTTELAKDKILFLSESFKKLFQKNENNQILDSSELDFSECFSFD